MSSGTVLTQMKRLVEKAQALRDTLPRLHPTDDQWDTLQGLCSKLSASVSNLVSDADTLRKTRMERAWKESKDLRAKAQISRGEVFGKGLSKHSAVFRRNITTIFGGPKASKFDSEEVQIRKESTRSRCKQISCLHPDAIISWAVAFPPTTWAVGSMSSDLFECLLVDIEPDLPQAWPDEVLRTVRLLQEDEDSLMNCSAYNAFITCLEDPKKERRNCRKRPRWCMEENEGGVLAPEAPSNEKREMKHLYTNAPISFVSTLPEPLRKAVENSRLWKWERTQPDITSTETIATLFRRTMPKMSH